MRVKKDKVIVVLTDLFHAKKLYTFKSDNNINYAVSINKQWVDQNGVEANGKIWVEVEYVENDIVIKSINKDKFKQVMEASNREMITGISKEIVKEDISC